MTAASPLEFPDLTSFARQNADLIVIRFMAGVPIRQESEAFVERARQRRVWLLPVGH